MKIKNNKAFTLAEVLITIGIIGVVAAMTIPTLLSNYTKKRTITKLQRAISVLNQAYRQSVDDVGDSIDEAYNMGTENYINTYWAPYIKINQICKTYSDCGYKSNTPFYNTDGKTLQGSAAFIQNSRIGIRTMDGFTYIIFTSSWKAGEFNIPTNWVWVDLNGPAAPNTFGKDVFFLLRVEDKGIMPYGYDQPQSYIDANCKQQTQGATCAEKIRRAGWVIDKSYPWK